MRESRARRYGPAVLNKAIAARGRRKAFHSEVWATLRAEPQRRSVLTQGIILQAFGMLYICSIGWDDYRPEPDPNEQHLVDPFCAEFDHVLRPAAGRRRRFRSNAE
jgi:hypothetical protein